MFLIFSAWQWIYSLLNAGGKYVVVKNGSSLLIFGSDTFNDTLGLVGSLFQFLFSKKVSEISNVPLFRIIQPWDLKIWKKLNMEGTKTDSFICLSWQTVHMPISKLITKYKLKRQVQKNAQQPTHQITMIPNWRKLLLIFKQMAASFAFPCYFPLLSSYVCEFN